MRYLLIDGTETPDELCEAITALRAKQRNAVIGSTRDEIGADIDELIELWATKTAPAAPPAA